MHNHINSCYEMVSMVCTDIVTFPWSAESIEVNWSRSNDVGWSFFQVLMLSKGDFRSWLRFDHHLPNRCVEMRSKVIIYSRGIPGQWSQWWHNLLILTGINGQGGSEMHWNVLYRLKETYKSLDRASSCIRRRLSANTQFDGFHYLWPGFRYYRLT